VGQIAFTNNGNGRMTTTQAYDAVNRLTEVSSAPAGANAGSFAYDYNPANQRVLRQAEDGSYWRYEHAFDDIGNRVRTGAGRTEGGSVLPTWPGHGVPVCPLPVAPSCSCFGTDPLANGNPIGSGGDTFPNGPLDRLVSGDGGAIRPGWDAGQLQLRRKNDPQKLALAARLRRETTFPLKAMAARAGLGSCESANATLHRWRAQRSETTPADLPNLGI